MERLVRVILWQRPDAGPTEITVAPRSAAISQTRTARIKGSSEIALRNHAGAGTRESERLKTMPRAEYTNMSHARLRLLYLLKSYRPWSDARLWLLRLRKIGNHIAEP
jgi:hypothetical protein